MKKHLMGKGFLQPTLFPYKESLGTIRLVSCD